MDPWPQQTNVSIYMVSVYCNILDNENYPKNCVQREIAVQLAVPLPCVKLEKRMFDSVLCIIRFVVVFVQ